MASSQPPVLIVDAATPLGQQEEAERRALNRAFREMGLSWYWEMADYREVASAGDVKAKVQRFLETRQPALLAAYDAAFLARLVGEIVARTQSEYSQAALAPTSATHTRRGWSPGGHSVDFVA